MAKQKKRSNRCTMESVEPRLLYRIIYVDPNAPGTYHDGTSWETAYTSYETAVIYSTSGDQWKMADAVYKPTTTTNRNTSFVLRSGVSMQGGYAGYGAPDPDERNPSVYQTVFSGDIGVPGDSSDNSYHVFNNTLANLTVTPKLDGIVISGGNANGDSDASRGGAIFLSRAQYINCIFSENKATTGGAIYGIAQSTFTNCTFINNSADEGGAFYADQTALLTNCTFSGNSATRGGAVYAANTLTTSGGTFTANSATASGGAIYAPSNAGVTLTATTFTQNASPSGGGVYIGTGATSLLNRCTFNGNRASAAGGGVWTGSGNLKIFNSVFIANTSNNGAGLKTTAQLLLLNSTFTSNVSLVAGRNLVGISGQVTNCIFWDLIPQPDNGVVFDDAITYSDLRAAPGDSHNVTIDPMFMQNPSPGADGTFGTADDNYGDLRLNAYSPLVDAADTFAMTSNSIGNLDAGNRYRYFDVPTAPDSGTGAAPRGDLGANEALPTRIATTGGPYAAIPGHQLQLQARGASVVAGPLTFEWDLDNDGQFDDAIGANATITIPALAYNSLIPLAVRMTDGGSVSVTSSSTIRIVAPYLYVDDSATGANNGTTWNDALTSLQAAMLAVLPEQEIHIAAGIYFPTTTVDRRYSFQLRPGLVIRGGYAGVAGANPDLRDLNAFPAILSGDIGTPGTMTDNCMHVVDASATDATTILDGVRIADGYNGAGSSQSNNAAGMLIVKGSPVIQNCTFMNNQAYYGGGVAEYNSATTYLNCTFVNNGYGRGAGVYTELSLSKFVECTFSNPTSADDGSGIYGNGGSPAIQKCEFRGNVYPPTYFYNCASVSIMDCKYLGNGGGGVRTFSVTQIKISGCLFVGNRAGAINMSGTEATVVDCTFAENTEIGFALQTYSSLLTLKNCIFWSALTGASSQIYPPSINSTLVFEYCDIQGGYAGAGNINSNPLFVRSPSKGADNSWGTADDDYGDLRLQAGSPCIDVGDNSAAIGSTDFAGNARIVDVPGVNDPGAIIDMGAYERQLPVFAGSGLLMTDGAMPAARMSFNVPLNSASISTSDLIVQTILGDGTIGAAVAVSSFSYDPVMRTVSFAIPTTVPDGNYRATLAAGAVSDADGIPMPAEYRFDFFAFAGDANHDRKVDINDFAALVLNWQQPGRVFSQGDFNYDGKVDAADLAILSARWQQTLAPAPIPAAPADLSLRTPARKPIRVATLVGV